MSVAYSANLIPAMTSATAPSGVASESGYVTDRVAWKSFNHTNADYADGWLAGVMTGWLQYQFPAAHTVTRYAVTSRNEADPNVMDPKTWTFEGSNDGAAWTPLDAQTNVTDWAATPNVRKVFDLANTTAYAYYRLDITASNGTYVGVGEMEMMEDAGAPPPPATYVPRSIGSGIGSGIASGIA